MEDLLREIRACTHCLDHLPLGPRPILEAHPESKVAVISQAPGYAVHQSGVAWMDPSGVRLRNWMGVSEKEFYDTTNFAIIPSGFCYPGRGKSGDLPPRPECAPLWHEKIFRRLQNLELLLVIGQYAQARYLDNRKRTLTETVRNYTDYLPRYFPLPHPSGRNNIWLAKNPWFEEELIPELRNTIRGLLGSTSY